MLTAFYTDIEEMHFTVFCNLSAIAVKYIGRVVDPSVFGLAPALCRQRERYDKTRAIRETYLPDWSALFFSVVGKSS